MRRTVCSLLFACLLSAGAWGQSTPDLKFEAASIRPAPDPASAIAAGNLAHLGIAIDDARVDIGTASLKQLIAMAYKVQSYQVECPSWMNTDPPRFNVQAAIPAGLTRQQVPRMMQALLAERFRLTLHRETKDQPVYALVVGKNGPKLTAGAPDGDEDGMSNGPFGPFKASFSNGIVHFEYARMTMPSLAAFLSQGQVGRQVVDMTGLGGAFRVPLDIGGMLPFSPAGSPVADKGGSQGQSTPTASDPSDNSIFASLQRVGLSIEKRRAPIEMLVVDRAERMPTEN